MGGEQCRGQPDAFSGGMNCLSQWSSSVWRGSTRHSFDFNVRMEEDQGTLVEFRCWRIKSHIADDLMVMFAFFSPPLLFTPTWGSSWLETVLYWFNPVSCELNLSDASSAQEMLGWPKCSGFFPSSLFLHIPLCQDKRSANSWAYPNSWMVYNVTFHCKWMI